MRKFVSSLVLCLIAVSCGVPLDDAPVTIASDDLPNALRPSTTSTTTLRPGLGTETVSIYLVDPAEGESRLVAVDREVSADAPSIAQATLEQLLAGPTSDEQLEANLTSRVIAGEEPIDVLAVAGEGLVSIVLSAIPTIEGGEATTAFAQMVFTLTEFDGIDSVSFFVRDESGTDQPVAVSTDTEEGEVQRAVSRLDYVSVAPRT